jgi:hypothetical protein
MVLLLYDLIKLILTNIQQTNNKTLTAISQLMAELCRSNKLVIYYLVLVS